MQSTSLSDFLYASLQCDGQKPVCSPCIRRGTECAYSPRNEMNAEERAELEKLRQQHEAPMKAPVTGSHDEEILHRLKSLPEDEAVALLLQVRAGARVNQAHVSSGLESGPFHPRLLGVSWLPEPRP